MSRPNYNDRILDLAEKLLQGTITPEERKELEEWESGRLGAPVYVPKSQASSDEELGDRMLKAIRKNTGIEARVVQARPWRRLVAAAAVLLLVLGGWWIFQPGKLTDHTGQQAIAQKDALPGREAAILTLADGRQILLDSTNGTITTDNGTRIINAGGLLSYAGKSGADGIVYNTISTARGNQYQLLLEDGTKVWLNSASSLRYPVAFKGAERVVELRGEGYFEVAPDKARPFHVKTPTQEIRVLGTHFNINSYSDEASVRTTLLEGSVKVTEGDRSVVLKPGQQALSTNGGMVVTDKIDLDKVMAWKGGWFDFDDTDFPTIMRQISRWYDVDVVYKGTIPKDKLGGRINRSVPLSKVLQSLEVTGARFQLGGKVLTVSL